MTCSTLSSTLRFSAICSMCVAILCAAGDGDWPRFRGPDGNGVARLPLPAALDVAWKAAVPAEGFSSPVVWGTRVFLSGGDGDKREVMCFDSESGKLLWESRAPGDEKFDVPDQSGVAAPTVATDGKHVYAIFANGDVAAFDFDGKVAWSKQMGAPMNAYGHTTSLLKWRDRVIVQFDQGDPGDKLSKLLALDAASGEVVWEKPRDVGASWATPITFEAAGGPQLLTLAPPMAISYSPADGAELWRAECLDGEVTPSPVYAGGTAFIVSPLSKLLALRVDGHGDVLKSHVLWQAEDGIPDITSPAVAGGLAFVIDTGGVLTCYDAGTGRKQWEHDMEMECKASPTIVGGRVVLVSVSGVIVVIDAARAFKELTRSDPVGEQVFASPAFARGHVFIRGLKHLFCLGATPK